MSDVAKIEREIAQIERKMRLSDRVFGAVTGVLMFIVVIVLPVLAK